VSTMGSGTGRFISMDDVSIRLDGRIVFEHTSWQMLNDQHWAVVGPNGSGKSILMRALRGELPVVEGRITYHFLESEAPGFRLEDAIAHVSFDVQRSVVERESRFHQMRWNSGVAGETLPVSDYLSEERVRRVNPYQVTDRPAADPAAFSALRRSVLERLGIEHLLVRRLAQLSNGEMRKVLIARALLKRPRLLVLDNPFTGLDQEFRARLRHVIQALTQDETRVIVVTGRCDEVPPGITHVLMVEDGRVVAQGPRDALLPARPVGVPVEPHRPARLRLVAPERQEAQGGRREGRVLVRMEDVRVSYDGTKILDRVTWTVRKGENWALLGPNGSGKTTLLSLILGDNPQAYANGIVLFGRRRGSGESVWEIKHHIGWVSAELHLYYPGHLSCLDVVCSGFFDSVGLYRSPSPAQREAAREWLGRLGGLKWADLPFGAVSQGGQRVVLLARALVKRPLLLLLDEPCQGLDAANRERLLAVIDALEGRPGNGMIYVTHDPDELPRSITHVMRLDRGRVVSQGALRPLDTTRRSRS